MTNEAETAASSKRVMAVLVVLFIVLVALWATSSIDSLVGAGDETSAQLLPF
ncbi:MAG: hypothetical protein WD895_00060 [Acidimicrobiia bacterium]